MTHKLYPVWWEVSEGKILMWTKNRKNPIHRDHPVYKKEISFIQDQISKYNIYEGEIIQ